MNTSSGITSPVNAAIQGNGGNGAQLAQIIKLPADLQTTARSVRLDGQIIAQNRQDSSVTIRTDAGEIQVQVKGNRSPEVGQRVEIDIPAGRPPRNAEVRTAPQNPPTNTQTANRGDVQPNTTQQVSGNNASRVQPQPVQTSQPQNAGTQANRSTQAVQQQALPPVIQNSTAPVQQNQPPQVLTSDVTVRVLSVPPSTANTIAQQTLQNLAPPTNATPSVVNNTNAPITLPNISQTAINTVINNAAVLSSPTPNLNTTTPLLNNNNIATLQTPSNVQVTSPLSVPAPAQTNLNANTPQILQVNQTLPTQVANQLVQQITAQGTLNAGQTATNIVGQLTGQNTAQNIGQASNTPSSATIQNATLTPLPLNFDPNNPNTLNTARPSQIDIQIIKTTPPTAQLLNPNATTPTAKTIPALTNFPPLTAGNNTATSLTAQVTGFTNNGLPLITIQGVGGNLTKSFVLQAPNSNLQLGSQLQIIPKGGALANSVQPLPLNAMRGINNPLLQGFQWQSVDDLYQALQSLNSQSASSLGRSLPNPGTPNQLGPAAMMFIAAIKSGNFEAILGDKKIDLLQRMGKGNILEGMSQNARAGAPESATQSDWRAVPLPMFWEGEIHKITLFTHKDNDANQQQDKNENGSTRFIFDLALTRMGDVQIDGLIKDKRLDLILRTENSFSEPMQQTMRQAYTTALNAAELSGELNFQGSTKNWVHVLEKEAQLGVSI